MKQKIVLLYYFNHRTKLEYLRIIILYLFASLKQKVLKIKKI